MNFRLLHDEVVRRLLEGEGMASQAQRRAAFDNEGLSEPLTSLVDKVAICAYKISDQDIEAVKKSGATEDQIFELVICAAAGQATRQYERALEVLDDVLGKGSDTSAS